MGDRFQDTRVRRRRRGLVLLVGLVASLLSIGLLLSLFHYRPEFTAMSPTRLPYALARNLTFMLGVAAAPAANGQPLPAPRPTAVGVNLAPVNWYAQERSFANLAMGGEWQIAFPGRGWAAMPAQHVAADGSLRSLPPGGQAVRMLTRPNTGPTGAMIHCTFQGSGAARVAGAATEISASRGLIRFRWTNRWNGSNVWLQVASTNTADPVRAVDCREATTPREARFDPSFLRSMTGFKTLRFMDWQRTNANAAVTWAARNTPATIDISDGAGVAVEDMVALSVATGADPWFTVPWNASADYVERFARLVHDTLPADRTVYVEVGNEVWNNAFLVTRQANQEGAQRALSPNPRWAMQYRLAERTVEVMRVWTRIFADRPSRLVRVLSVQHVQPWTGELMLTYRDTAAHVDALATAPYFGHDLMSPGRTTDLNELFRRLGVGIDQTINQAVINRTIAAKYRKRYIAYEAGQHVVIPDNVGLLYGIQRDPRMYDTYKRYIAGWRNRVGDTLALFNSAHGFGAGGAWGLAEYSGQPPAEAPKLRAVLEERVR